MWFAVRTRARHESAAARYLEAHGIEQFLPVYKTRRQWSDRVKVMEWPLFSGYLFTRIDSGRFTPVLEAPGVVGIVGFGGTPAPVPEADILAVRRLVASGLPANPHPYLKAGDRVRIKGGPLDQMEGVLQKVRNQWRFILTVDMLQRAVSVEVDSELVEPAR
ncbi:MAG: NusG-like protein [Candidatus Solibacter sp.]|nr:NusG-like protein [Candidatus Solibacter sp.]